MHQADQVGPTAPRTTSRRAWSIVLASAVMVAMAFGAIVNIAVFLTPLSVEFGWGRADLTLAYGAASLATGLGGIVMGHLADRIQVRYIALTGAIVPAVAFWMLSRMSGLVELYLWNALLGFFGVGALVAPLNRLAGLWMADRPGFAIGIVTAGGALGQGLMPFLSRHLVLVTDWRQAYVIMAALYVAVLLPLALTLRDVPRQEANNSSPDDYQGAGQHWWRLGWLSLAVVFCCSCMATPIVHVAALGGDRGMGGRESAGLLATMMIAGALGRIGFGKVADRLGSLRAYVVAVVGQTATAFLFPVMTSPTALYVLSAVFGVVFSGAMTAFILCAREFSPPKQTGLGIGIVMLAGWIGMGIGGWQGGLFYDLCGSYEPGFSVASLSGVISLIVLARLWLRSRPTSVSPLHRIA